MTAPAALPHCPCRLPSHPPHWHMVSRPDWKRGAVCAAPSDRVSICCDVLKARRGKGGIGHACTPAHPARAAGGQCGGVTVG